MDAREKLNDLITGVGLGIASWKQKANACLSATTRKPAYCVYCGDEIGMLYDYEFKLIKKKCKNCRNSHE